MCVTLGLISFCILYKAQDYYKHRKNSEQNFLTKGNLQSSCKSNNLEGIFNKLLENNYDGGKCRDEQYDSTGENKIGWTDKENAEKLEVGPNPMLGFEGMMLELGLTNRSSIGYGSHDFMLVMGSMEAMKALGAYDPTEHLDMYRKVIAGNEDFLYKCEVGFYSGVKVWYTGGEWRITRYDESAFGVTYWMWKYVWRNYYLNDPDAIAGA